MSGVLLTNDLSGLVFESDGKDTWSSCFGVVFHRIVKDLARYGAPKPDKKSKS